MITLPDFSKKQMIFVMCKEGEKISFSNDNLVVKTKEGNIKFQCSCYRIFLVFVVGHFSLTSALIEKTKKFGFFIALMTQGFKLYDMIGNGKDGNTLLKRNQYEYKELLLAKYITKNKLFMQQHTLKKIRNKDELTKEAIRYMGEYIDKISSTQSLHEIMGYEGLGAKIYFKNHFTNVCWNGRQPRMKRDYVNATLDIGYTLLFTFIEAILLSHGFDTYCGVLHRQFYMRKSLVCDIMEPFRTIIDVQVKKSINLKQIKEEDFKILNNQYRLKWEKSSDYVTIFMEALLECKEDIFMYIQSYYRAFMKKSEIEKYPFYQGRN